VKEKTPQETEEFAGEGEALGPLGIAVLSEGSLDGPIGAREADNYKISGALVPRVAALTQSIGLTSPTMGNVKVTSRSNWIAGAIEHNGI
jgi:hypothetical protein